MSVINSEQNLVEKFRSLPPDKQQEILDFTEFLCQKFTVIDRRAFMQLPLEERRRILSAQSEQMVSHYEQNTEWREWTEANIGDLHEYEPQT
jgi:Protein of unknown function (DUF2281)